MEVTALLMTGGLACTGAYLAFRFQCDTITGSWQRMYLCSLHGLSVHHSVTSDLVMLSCTITMQVTALCCHF